MVMIKKPTPKMFMDSKSSIHALAMEGANDIVGGGQYKEMADIVRSIEREVKRRNPLWVNWYLQEIQRAIEALDELSDAEDYGRREWPKTKTKNKKKTKKKAAGRARV